jgi:nucleoside-diphosphate-sugar epimerase
MRRALLTGATSYPGRALAARLTADGVDVHAIVRPASDLSRLQGLARQVSVHVHDGRTDSLLPVFDKASFDVVFHLAGRYVREHATADVEPLVRDNVLFGAQVLEAAARAGVRRFVNTGTYFQHMDGDEARAVDLYAAAKEAFRHILAYYGDAHGIAFLTLVLFDTFGPGDWRRRRLMAAIRDCQRTGAALPVPKTDEPLNFVYMEDVVEAFVQAARLLEKRPEQVAGRRFAVRTGEPRTIAEIVALFEEVGGRPIKVQRGAYAGAARRVETLWRGPLLPGWRPKIDLKEGIRRFLAEG